MRGDRLPPRDEVLVNTRKVESADGTPLRVVVWDDVPAGSGNPRDVLLVHGYAEHAGRYTHVGAALNRAGYRVTFVELRGHGESGGQRGHVDRWRRYVEDLWAAATCVEGSFAVVAHSMGGLVVFDALREAIRQPVLGVATSNPLVALGFVPPKFKVKAAGLLSRLLPRLNMPGELDPNNICRDPDVVRRYIADPLVFDTITPRWFTEMLGATARVRDAGPRMSHPLLMLVGEADAVTSPKAAIELGERWGGPKVVRRYPGLYHELFNEPEKEQVLGDLIAWLNTLHWEA